MKHLEVSIISGLIRILIPNKIEITRSAFWFVYTESNLLQNRGPVDG